MNQESRRSPLRVSCSGTSVPELSMADYRIERDTFGEIRVPADRLWGAQTQRSLENFRISGERMPMELIRALALVKRWQSSNDVFPTAMSVAAVQAIHDRLMPALSSLRDALSAKSEAFIGIVKIGRTHLQDATPLTLGQEVSGWVSQLDHGIAHVRAS